VFDVGVSRGEIGFDELVGIGTGSLLAPVGFPIEVGMDGQGGYFMFSDYLVQSNGGGEVKAKGKNIADDKVGGLVIGDYLFKRVFDESGLFVDEIFEFGFVFDESESVLGFFFD